LETAENTTLERSNLGESMQLSAKGPKQRLSEWKPHLGRQHIDGQGHADENATHHQTKYRTEPPIADSEPHWARVEVEEEQVDEDPQCMGNHSQAIERLSKKGAIPDRQD
jgi:hypothetical protein